ncbi:unnamed protein product [Candidula unifasciata]|uniref:Uncharacterized protein n=1 Tax=Candidula unifasciata TaxID=100452 RepID=A0A8S4A4S3_9EUPU|nr:unnamed protein product [Candidula unifasciata]
MEEDPGSIVRIEYNTIELPPSVEIRESSVSSGQAGAFSKTLIPKDTKFGPYKGEIINAGQKNYIDYRFAWEVFEKDSNVLRHTVSALDPKSSNWMRHVNCARFYEEQNILSIQEEYSIFYVAMKNIKPGEELLTWFDPKLLKRTKRRLSKMGRKPVGYTIELVPWSDEKKFVPEIIETKRKRKKKVLSDMISLDENPLVITRTLQSLSKIPCTPKQIAQSSFRGAPMNVGVKTSRAVLPALAPKRENKAPTQNMIICPQKTANKVNEYITGRSNTERGKQNGSDKVRCTSLEGDPTTEVMQKETKEVVCSGGDAVKITDKKVNKNMLLKKNAMKLGRARLQFSAHRQLLQIDNSSIKPVVVKQNEDGSTSVEDHDETYVLNNIELRPECDDECPCMASNKSVKSHSSVKDKPDTFVIHFTLLPEHKSLSADNKIIYRCDVCDGAYNHAFSLKRHYLSVHVNHRYLSRDDILSCQIETFHMDIDLQNEHAEIKIGTLKDGESSVLKVQSADQTTSVSSSGQAEMHDPDNLEQSPVKECENNDKENISCDVRKVTVAQQYTSVPSLKQLVQVLLGKASGTTETSCSLVKLQKLSMTCGEVKTGSCIIDSCIRSKGTEPMSLDLPRQLDSSMDCVISSSVGTESESLGLSQQFDSGMDCVISSSEGTEPESLSLPHQLDSGMDCVISSSEGTEPESFDLPHQLDSGIDCVIPSSGGTEPESLGLPHQLDSGMDCVISEQNEGISKAGAVSLDVSLYVQIDMEKKPEGSTGEIMSAHEDILCKADEISADSFCAQDKMWDLNPNRLGHHNKSFEISSSLNRNLAPEVADSIDILDNPEWGIPSETSELSSDLLIKTITGDLQENSHGDVCGKNDESRDLCLSHWNQVFANHSEESAAALNEGSPTADIPDCSAAEPDIMQQVDTVSTGSVLGVFNMAGTDCPGEIVPCGDSSSHTADSLKCFDHSSPTASSPPFILSQEFPSGVNGVSPVVEPAGLIDISPAVDTMELNDVPQVVDTAELIDVSPVLDTAGLIDMSPVVDAAESIDVSPVVDTAGLIDMSPIVDTAGLIKVSPAVDTAGLIEVSPVVHTAELIEVSPVVDTAGLIEVSPVVDTAGSIEVSPIVDAAGLIQMSPIVDTAGLIKMSPVVHNAGLIEVSPVVHTAGLIAVSPVVDTNTTIESCDFVSPVVNSLAGSSSEAAACEPVQNMDFVTNSVTTQEKPKSLDNHLPKNCTIQTVDECSASTTTSTSVIQGPPSAQKLIFVTNLVFPIVSPSHQPHTSSSSCVSPGPSPLTAQTSQSASVPLVVISQVPCGLSMQNAASAFLPSSSTLKAFQTVKSSFSVLNFGNTSSGLSLSVLSPGSNSSNSSVDDKVLLDSSFPHGMSAAATTPNICSASEQTTEKLVKPRLNLCAQFAAITPMVFGGPHVPASSAGGSAKCTSPPTKLSFSSISSLTSAGNVSLVEGQPDDLYRCHMCVRVFRTMNELKLHIRNDPHRFKGGIKQYACQQCSMRFSNKNNLIRHNLMNHLESENYKFRCYTCGKGFMCETYLKMHARFHSGRNFPCKYGCTDVYFPNAASLVKHLRTQHPGLNLKEYLRNAKACKAHSKKLSCLLQKSLEQNTSPETEGQTLERSQSVASKLCYSLEQPGLGFQAKRGHSKSLKAAAILPQGEERNMADQRCGVVPDNEGSPPNAENISRLRYVCHMCLKGFRSHLKLLQHRTHSHGANESVQEYLYEMSKDTLDEDLSDTVSVKLKFSPPPSPTSFFENVNKRGFENMNHYIDGNIESLQFWQKHLNLEDNSEPLLVSEAVKKLEWTTFNFPPCFEYREDCTVFYDSTTQPGTSPRLLPYLAEDLKETGNCRAHASGVTNSDSEDASVAALKPETTELRSQTLAESILHCEDDTGSQKDSSCMDVDGQGLVGTGDSQDHVMESHHGRELNKSVGSATRTGNCEPINYSEKITLEQNDQCTFVNLVAEKQEINERDALSEESVVEDVLFEDKVSVTRDDSVIIQEVEAENHYICRHIVGELVNSAESAIEEKYSRSRPDSMLDGNSNLKVWPCEGAQSASAADAPSSGVVPPGVEVEIKQETTEPVQEINSTSGEPFILTDMISHKFIEFSTKDKLDLFKSQCIQGLDLAVSEHNHTLLLQKGLLPRVTSVSHLKSHNSQSLLGALDLQIMNGQWSSETLDHKVGDGCRQAVTSMKKRALSLESLILWPRGKQSVRHFDHVLDNSLNNSDTSRHDHRRYSIWTGQVHQRFDSSSKHDMFCQPVTEAVRKQEVMRETAQYNYEKSIRDNEMRGRDEKVTLKASFAESLGLMSRNEFELSYHARREQQFIIKVPEVWSNYENIWFGKKGNITVVCSVCHRHFSCWDLCLRHQLKKHPHIEPASLEMEKDNYVEDMFYYYPMPYGILAQTHLIPDNLPVPEVFVCLRCGFPFKNINRLHAHMIICDPAQEDASSGQNNGVRKVSYMKKKLLPMMDRRLHQQVEQPKTKVSKTKSGVDVSAAFVETRHNKSLPVNGKTGKPAQHTLDNKLMASAVHSRTDYSTDFSFYSCKKGKNYELLYNPQNHTRRREMYKILDQHQCHGCNLKFNSLYMLEKHVNKCSGKDKLQNQKPLLSGIMPDDAALRKQHTCRYCGKRFTYIKGVDLHYKRICAVRKVKEEENQLTEEDLAHEAELKKILEHIKWSKSLSKDSSDIIQGHVRVEEDGTLTRVVKDSDCSPGQKKKVKKKGSNWTTLKRHRMEEDVDSASSVSSDIHRSPGNTKNVADEKVADNLDVVGKKRLTRSAGQEGFHEKNGIRSRRPTSAERGTAGKKADTSLKSALVNSSSKSHSPSSQNKAGSGCHSLKGTSKKMACSELIDVSESRKNKGKGSVVTSGSSRGTRSRQIGSIVSPADNVTICIKPPDRKRGKPKRFDPSDMESSYKKKRKDEDIIFEQTKPESGGRKRNATNETKQKVSTAAKGIDVGKSSHVMRPISSRSSTDVSASAPTSKVCVNKNQSNKVEESKLFEKMKKLKEAAKSESRKSSQKRKLSVSLFTNFANKKCDSGASDEKKSDKPVNKVSNSSELFKHLTTSEKSLQKHSPQKTASNRKRISSMDDDDEVNSSQMSAKHIKITTQNGRSKSPAKPGLSTSSHDMESPSSHFNKVAQKCQNKSQDRYESDQEPLVVRTSSSARILSSSATNLSADSKSSLSKPTSPISKRPTVTFKVVTLSPNGSNLLTYDSSADVPQSSLLLTKPSKGASHSLPAQQILKCLPQRPIQFVTKTSSLLQGTELKKICREPNIKVISAENLGLNVVRKQAVSTLVSADGDNIRIQKPVSQVCNQGFISQKDVQCRASSSPDGKQALTCRAVYKQDNNETSQSLHDTETQISHHVASHSQGRVIIQRVVDKHFRDNQLLGNICESQVMPSSAESSLTDSTDEIFPKQSQKTSEKDISQLCPANLLFTKQTGDAGTADENPPAEQNQAVVSSISSLLTLTEPQPQCQKQQTFAEQSNEVCNILQSVSQSCPRSSNIASVKSFPALHVANSSSTNNPESVSTIVVPSTTVKVHVTLPHAVSTTTATKLSFPNRFRSPPKVVTVTGTVLPHLSMANPGHTATRILKLGAVSIKSTPVSTTQPQNITVHNKQVSNSPCVVPQNITKKPLVVTAGQLPRLLTPGARHQRPNTQQIIMPGALRQSVLNIAANQTNCTTQILPGRCLPKTVSPQISIPQSSLGHKIVNVAQPLGVPNVGSSLPVSSIKSRKTSSICLIPAPVSPAPSSNQIMFSLDDGTTAMLDPDSLAQFLTVSPSLSKSELYSTVPPPTAVQEYNNPLVLNVAGNQQIHSDVEEINWPANGTVDLIDLPDTVID